MEHYQIKLANRLMDLTPVIFGQGFDGISDLEIGPDGYLYVVSYAHVCTPSTGQELSSRYNIQDISKDGID